jgi:hypothetical protein
MSEVASTRPSERPVLTEGARTNPAGPRGEVCAGVLGLDEVVVWARSGSMR